ncbi:Na+/H+ antiporter NhaC [Peribacillus asahii]|uniref:Sodium:proton antiporter n=1 Tax=Peribacillus asahii TaxID=228899 RepID=A0A3T0KQH8_9BACI|nr:Na+/H+ antiporter NhaC [Peribacillus asahii]AZV42626.1 sodium:proton antiporter [Peribacillus asahii]USK86894.1 Na+/H+ antiporter NhaC [Peribacillus asahii]
MKLENAKLKLPCIEATIVLACLFIIIGTGIIYFEMIPHMPILGGVLFLLLYGRIKGVSFSIMERAMMQGASSGLGAIYIFFFIGMLISSWMASGTIPTIMFYGFEFISGQAFYAVVFLITSLIGLCIGSSLTTAATIGVAFIGMASSLDFSLAITAGAIISGAFLGDKMSPLSDSTNLASGTVGVPLFEHIKNMLWTTIPGFVVTLVLFFFLSPKSSGSNVQEIEDMLSALSTHTTISLWSLLPFIVVGGMALKKVSAIPTLAAGIVSAIAITFIETPTQTVKEMANVLYSGFVLNSGVEQLDTILSRGGIESMYFSISLVLLALAMGGLLFELGIIPSILNAIQGLLINVGRLISATVFTGIGVNFLAGEQYLSVLLPGKAFQNKYSELGLEGKSLTRVLEDAGTVVNPLVPWGVCGVFLTQVLGVTTLEYAPFAFFCIVCPILSLVSGWTKIGLHFKK